MLEKWRSWPQGVEKGRLGRRTAAVMTLWRLEWGGGVASGRDTFAKVGVVTLCGSGRA